MPAVLSKKFKKNVIPHDNPSSIIIALRGVDIEVWQVTFFEEFRFTGKGVPEKPGESDWSSIIYAQYLDGAGKQQKIPLGGGESSNDLDLIRSMISIAALNSDIKKLDFTGGVQGFLRNHPGLTKLLTEFNGDVKPLNGRWSGFYDAGDPVNGIERKTLR